MCGVKDMVYRDGIVFGLDSNLDIEHVEFHFNVRFLRFFYRKLCRLGEIKWKEY